MWTGKVNYCGYVKLIFKISLVVKKNNNLLCCQSGLCVIHLAEPKVNRLCKPILNGILDLGHTHFYNN
ncbi:hypothetical protein B6N25_12955 [Sphingobacteriales bacterium TSM_CSS]|nr:hypothetical protein B6N25_12955 [Sphingobacteriales bacterium TSM_CSS]